MEVESFRIESLLPENMQTPKVLRRIYGEHEHIFIVEQEYWLKRREMDGLRARLLGEMELHCRFCPIWFVLKDLEKAQIDEWNAAKRFSNIAPGFVQMYLRVVAKMYGY